MLQKDKRVADAVRVARFDQLILDVESGGVVDAAEMDEVEDHRLKIVTEYRLRAKKAYSVRIGENSRSKSDAALKPGLRPKRLADMQRANGYSRPAQGLSRIYLGR